MKKKTNIIIIGIIVFLLVVTICVGGYFLLKDKKIDDASWLDSYYNLLLDDFNNNEIYADVENVSIQFVDTPDYDLPMMAVIYEKNNMQQMNHYAIAKNKDGYASWLMSKGNNINFNYELVLLYDIEKKEYAWFEYRAGTDALGENYWFTSFKQNGGESTRFLPDEIKENQTEADGIPILSKYEEKFIKINTDFETIKIDNIHNIDEDYLKESLNLANSQYKKLDDIITDEIKSKTQNKLAEIESKKGQIKVANEEKAKKKAEEEAAKKAEEDAQKKAEEQMAKNSFKVGNYTMMYGTYIGSGGFDNFNDGATLVLNSNGTYTITRSGKTSSGTFTYTSDGYIDFDGGSWSYRALNNNVLGGTGYDEAFTYAGY